MVISHIHAEVQLIVLALHVLVHPAAVHGGPAQHAVLLPPPVVIIETPVTAMVVATKP